jgi:putative CocE/NonD family hydrolase
MANVVVEKNILIPMSDGVELAGDLFRPEGNGPWPAILCFIPYHKDGRGGLGTVEGLHRHFAGKGYACVTLDFRGLGNSGGTNPHPFDPQEAKDGHEAVEWIAAQKWCSGKVGMWGVSYGGITSLSVAATQPPHLAAIVPIHATADLFRGVVGLGNCRGGFWMQADWGPRMVNYNLMPPLYLDDAGRWARVWAEHLDGNPPWLFAWWDHPNFDEFWKSRVADLRKIKCPCFNICGWRDLYADDTVVDYNAIRSPKRLMMGPWKHAFPDSANEVPTAGLYEMERWFARWLKGEKNGIEAEPPVANFIQGDNAGWRLESAFPPRQVKPRTYYLRPDHELAPRSPAAAAPLRYRYDPTVGIQSIWWDPWSSALDPTLHRDQSGDDSRSLAFNTEAMDRPLELLGAPQATLEVTPSALPLYVVVKLADVAPNGHSILITLGWVDLAKVGGRAAGKTVTVDVPMRATSYRVAAGHRLRLTVASADFPRLWPTPRPAELSVHFGASSVTLPIAGRQSPKIRSPKWGPLQTAAAHGPAEIGGTQNWTVHHDFSNDMFTLDAARSESHQLDAFTRLHGQHRYTMAVASRRPDLTRATATTTVRVERPVGQTEVSSSVVTTGEAVSVKVDIAVDGTPYWSKSWSKRRHAVPARKPKGRRR